MIDAGLPGERADWPDGVLDALRPFRQGDVVDAPPLFYFADPTAAVWAATTQAALDEPDVVIVDDLCPYVIITSQTCDIAEEDSSSPTRPFVHVAPVYEAGSVFDASLRNLLRLRRGPVYLVHLPALPDGFWVADLRLELPVEKGWLAKHTPISGFPDEQAQEIVAERLGRIRERPALARRFVETVHRPLIDAIKSLRRNDRDQWQRVVEHVDQVRVMVDSRLNPTTAQLYILNDQRIPGDVEEWFRSWWDEINPRVLAAGITLHRLQVLTYGELSAAEYRASGELDLVRVSPI